MTSNQANKQILTCALQGHVRVEIYGEDNKLKRTVETDNVLTTSGLNRLVDQLIDGYNYYTPPASAASAGSRASILKDVVDFGAKDGEVFGVNLIAWPGREKCKFGEHGYVNWSYFSQDDAGRMVDGNLATESRWKGAYRENTYWTPGGSDQQGVVMELGWTEVVNEEVLITQIGSPVNLANKNLYYNQFAARSQDELETYTLGVDYTWDSGDGITYGSITVLNGALLNDTLKVDYTWYDVPQEPVVGFALRMGGSSSWTEETFSHAFSWGLDQGEHRTKPFFPWVNGIPMQPGWQTHYWTWPWYPTWQISAEPHTYFFESLPWAVINPVQLAFFGSHYQQDKLAYDFELLGLRMPKLGPHAVALGSGAGSPAVGDTDLFTRELKLMTERKYRDGVVNTTIETYLGFDEGNGTTYTEAGLFFPSDDTSFFKDDDYWTNTVSEHTYLKGNSGIVKVSPLDEDDCDTLMSHAMFSTPWSKTDAERVKIVYTFDMTWS